MTVYHYMYKIHTPEYGSVKATRENLIQEVGSWQKKGANSHMIITELSGTAQFAAKRFHLVPLG